MKNLFMTHNSATIQWLIFIAMLMAIGIGITCFIIWVFGVRKYGKKKRKHRRQRRHHRTNPTLAQTGGLPPVRDTHQPPRGV